MSSDATGDLPRVDHQRQAEYLLREINRMRRVLQSMGEWDAFCVEYAKRYPLGSGAGQRECEDIQRERNA